MAPKRTSPTKGARATAAAAAAARAPTLTAEGNSDSWESSKANQFRIANKFLEAVSDDALKDKWGGSTGRSCRRSTPALGFD